MAKTAPSLPPLSKGMRHVLLAVYWRSKGHDLWAWQHLNEALRFGHNDCALTERARLMADMGFDLLAEMDWDRVRRRTPDLPAWPVALKLWRYREEIEQRSQERNRDRP